MPELIRLALRAGRKVRPVFDFYFLETPDKKMTIRKNGDFDYICPVFRSNPYTLIPPP
jgi:hypothetical protein